MLHFVVILSYLVSFALVDWVIAPIQTYLLSSEALIGSLLFLPHGVRVLSAMLMGWRAFPALFLAHVLGIILIWEPGAALHFEELILLAIVGSASALLVWSAMRMAGIELAQSGRLGDNWRLVIFVGAVASFVNSLGTVAVIAVVHPEMVGATSLTQISVFAIGDTLGAFGLLLLLVLMRRIWRMQSSGVL